MPLLAPGTIAEILSLGLHAVALSRHAGCGPDVKIVTELADSAGVAQAGAAFAEIPPFAVARAHPPPVLLTADQPRRRA